METFVVPRYLSIFGDLALELMLLGDSAKVVHLGCRTGYPDLLISDRVAECSIVGFDASLPALELARNKMALRSGPTAEYLVSEGYPTELEDEGYSHVLSIHPIADAETRAMLFEEMARLLYSGGQALVAMPLKGSFLEIADLFREYALKNDDGDFGRATEESIANRPNLETLSEELENAGFSDVDVEVRKSVLTFDSGRAFAEDPVTRLLIVPELRASLTDQDLEKPLEYLRDAIDKYWSEGQFDLALNVGCASARKD